VFKNFRAKTERLILRPFTLEDLGPLHEIVSREAVMRYLPEGLLSLEDVEGILRWLVECYRKNTPGEIIKFTVAITDRRSGALIGWVGLGPLEFDRTEIELYYGLREECWGKGLATEAARAILAYGFSTLGLRRIVAVANPANPASSRVLEKLGMKYLKTIRGLPAVHGDYEGDLYYSILREDFAASPDAGG
jgi:ribosomal-protein-alanine N-acetyltransferase